VLSLHLDHDCLSTPWLTMYSLVLKQYLVQVETAQAMLDGTATSGDLLPVTDWAVLFCSPAVSPDVSPDVSSAVSPATSMPGSPVITSSATTSAARSGTPTAPPAALEAACQEADCQAAASPAGSKIALPKPLSAAQPACSAESEDVDEHPEELDWLYGPTKPRQQVCMTAAECHFACLLQCICLTWTACHSALLHCDCM